jgi:hypothetical protein
MRPVETVSEMGWGIRKNGGGGEFKYCKNICKFHNVSPAQQL